MIKSSKPFNVASPPAVIVQAFAKALAAKNLLHDYVTMVLFELVVRLQGSLVLRLEHLVNFVSDPNADSVARQQRLEVLDMLWRWAGNGPLDRTVRDVNLAFALHLAALRPVLSIEETRMLLTQVGRPWTIPYLVPRFFLGLEHAAALGFMTGADPAVPAYPVVVERIAEDQEQRHDPGAALVRWLQPYRNLRSDEPAIQDPRISDYIANQAAKLGITWDEWLPTRTYCAYRFALVGWRENIEARTGLPGWVITEAYHGMVSHSDALRYFDLSPRTYGAEVS